MQISVREVYVVKLCAEQIKMEIQQRRALDKAPTSQNIAAIRRQFNALSDAQLETKIGDLDRVRHYKHATWISREIPLSKCWVWPKMGETKWASGKLPDVAGRFDDRANYPISADKTDKFNSMAQNPTATAMELPIIAFVQEGQNILGLHPAYDGQRHDGEFDIDDGCHRAVVAWLAGLRSLIAMVGRLPRQYR